VQNHPQDGLSRSSAPSDEVPNQSTPDPSMSDSGVEKQNEDRFPVVGMVASAGGVKALKLFFEAIRVELGAAFVVVPHLDATHKSMMVELLSRQTSMPVVEVTDGMTIVVDHVYVIPPNYLLTVSNSQLHLSPLPNQIGTQTAIDFFLRSLAEDQGPRAIAVVLSGTGSHGTLGSREVKRCGGLVMTQSPDSAEFDQMPRSVIETGLVDLVLSPEQMPEALQKIVKQSYFRSSLRVTRPDEATLEQLNQIVLWIRGHTQYDFQCYRKSMLLRRVERRMGLLQFAGFADYLELLKNQPSEVQLLCNDFLIGVTQFFRDTDAFLVLEKVVIPALLANHSTDIPLHIWVPSCGTGEEAYSIAMLFLEAFEAAGKPANFQVFANDINEHSVDFARRGVYSGSIANDLTKSRLRQFFSTEDQSHFRVNKRLRDYLVFSVQNLLQDAPFSKMDLVSCRNVLIYFEPEVQQRLITLLHFALNENGYLILGPSETLGKDEARFESIDKKWRVFRRLGTASAIQSSLSVVKHFSPTAVLQTIPIITPRKTYKELAESLVLNEYAPASALINPGHEILNVTGPLIDFLEFPSGEMTKNLLTMARPGLRSKLRAACYQAKLEAKEVTIDHARVRRDGRNYQCSITIRPIRNLKLLEGCMLVLFQDMQSTSDTIAQTSPSGSQTDSPDSSMESTESSVIDLLEAELKATREELQNSAEQTRSFIEELQSSNEELESSKEELQSLNEELNTVNAQLLEKVSELDRSNDELTNVMASTEIATLFLDKLLRIKRVTRPATALFQPVSLKENDLLSAVQSPFIQPKMIEDCNAVLARAEPKEEEILAEDGRCFLRRVSPFRVGGNRSEGVVITFVDISERKRHENEQREQGARFREIYNNVASGIVITNTNGEIEQCNPAYCKILGYSEHELQGMQRGSFVHPDDQDREKEGIQRLLLGKKTSFEIENRCLRKDGKEVWVSKFFSLLPATNGESPKMIVLFTDISERVNSVRELQHSEEENRAILGALSSQIAVIDRNGVIVATNPAWDRIDKERSDTRYRSGIGTNYFEVLESVLGLSGSTNNSAQVISGVKDVLSGKIDGFRIEYPYHFHNTKSWYVLQANPLQHDRGGAVISHQDITDRVLSELKLKENQELLQLVVDTVPHYIYAKNKQGEFLFVNQYTADQCGCESPTEMVGQCEPGSATAKAQSLLSSQLDSEVIASGIPIFNMEEVVTDWKGDSHFVQTSKQQFRLPSSKEPVVLSVSIDITERKIAETKTHETNERLNAILNTASDAIITIDEDGLIDHVNKATESMFGYSLLELLGENVSILMPPPFRDEHDQYIQRFLRMGEGKVIGIGREIVCRRKDGSIFPADLAISQVDHTGLFTGILRDISSRKEMQKYALELAANEQRRIGLELHDGTQQELTGLTLYANALIETIEGKGAKPSGVGADGLEHWQFTDTDFRKMISTAKLMAQRLREANNHVRDLAHGIMPVQIDTEGLRSALSELAGSMDSVQLKCHVAFQGDLNFIHNTTATHLYRIAQEAVNNAIHHGLANEIWISLAQKGERITMEVSDNGIGIESASLAVADSSKRGMGMRTMEYRASLIGGVIQILPRPEGGTMMKCLILHEVPSDD